MEVGGSSLTVYKSRERGPLARKIRTWMTYEMSGFFKPNCATALAEQCADALDDTDTWLDDELHPVWDIALEFFDGE
jgi:hypothetical protein